MEVGKLYSVSQYFWLLYPSKDIAADVAERERPNDAVEAGRTGRGAVEVLKVAVVRAATYWSRRFSCNVSYISPSSIFMLLEENGEYCKVLTTEGMVGWIYFAKWCKDDIEEVKAE